MAEIDIKALRDMYRTVTKPLADVSIDDRIRAQKGLIEALPELVTRLDTLRGAKHTAEQRAAVLEADGAAMEQKILAMQQTLLFVYQTLAEEGADLAALRQKIGETLGNG